MVAPREASRRLCPSNTLPGAVVYLRGLAVSSIFIPETFFPDTGAESFYLSLKYDFCQKMKSGIYDFRAKHIWFLANGTGWHGEFHVAAPDQSGAQHRLTFHLLRPRGN